MPRGVPARHFKFNWMTRPLAEQLHLEEMKVQMGNFHAYPKPHRITRGHRFSSELAAAISPGPRAKINAHPPTDAQEAKKQEILKEREEQKREEEALLQQSKTLQLQEQQQQQELEQELIAHAQQEAAAMQQPSPTRTRSRPASAVSVRSRPKSSDKPAVRAMSARARRPNGGSALASSQPLPKQGNWVKQRQIFMPGSRVSAETAKSLNKTVAQFDGYSGRPPKKDTTLIDAQRLAAQTTQKRYEQHVARYQASMDCHARAFF